MAPTESKVAQGSFTTTGTVSDPLDLESLRPQGEHTAVKLSASSNIRPKPKVTLTSLTPNNVRSFLTLPTAGNAVFHADPQFISEERMLIPVRHIAKDQLGGHSCRLF